MGSARIIWPQVEDLAVVVDLDGTLVRTDLLVEGMVQLLKRSPHFVFLLAWWLCRGKARLKAEVARRAPLDVADLPYNEELLALLREARAEGFELVLATAADQAYADAVAAHVGLFDRILASDGVVNLSGTAKLARVTSELGGRPFCYAGDSLQDLPLWRAADAALVVNAGRTVVARAQAVAKVALVLPGTAPRRGVVARAMRLHQWAKNALVFVPLITAHDLRGGYNIGAAGLAFLAFGCCASAVYLVNDLADMADDRAHPEKRHRPLAAGVLRPGTAMLLAAVLLLAGVSFCALLPPAFAFVLGSYFFLTLLYSFRMKRVVLADVFLLATLYTIRILAGGAAAGVPISNWLMAFAMFFFLSLAFAKRYAEVRPLSQRPGDPGKVRGRGYLAEDLPLLSTMGVASGFVAALVFALYIHSEQGLALYRRSDWLWLICPIILYWVMRVWLLAHRGLMHSDPVVFALKDRASYALGAAAIVVMLFSM